MSLGSSEGGSAQTGRDAIEQGRFATTQKGVTLVFYALELMALAVLLRVAGAMLANKTEFVDPGLFSWHLSGELLVMILLGGLGSLGRARLRKS